MLLLLSADAALPLFAGDPESALPACCRRNGKHQCSMSADAGGSAKMVSARCPSFPQKTTAAKTECSQTPAPRLMAAPIYSHPAAKAQTEARYRTSHSRTREKRGPPVLA